MKRLLLLLLVLPTFVFAEGGLPNQPYIYVTGKAEIEKPADLVTLHFDLVARNPDLTKANQEVQAKATKILALLDERKIAKTDIIAEDLKSDPQYEEDEHRGPKIGKIIGYRVTRSFHVKARDVTSFGKLVNDLIATAGAEFSGINGGLSNEKKIQGELWQKALGDARERADETARLLGMKVDSVFAISRTAFAQIASEMFGDSYAEVTERAIVTGPPEYVLGPVSVTENVRVIYLISVAK